MFEEIGIESNLLYNTATYAAYIMAAIHIGIYDEGKLPV